MSAGPFPSSTIAIANRWQTLRGHTLVQVYASADGSDASKGIVIVKLIAWPEDAGISTSSFSPASNVGSLRITSASGNVLSLAAKDGTRFTFDTVSDALSAAP